MKTMLWKFESKHIRQVTYSWVCFKEAITDWNRMFAGAPVQLFLWIKWFSILNTELKLDLCWFTLLYIMIGSIISKHQLNKLVINSSQISLDQNQISPYMYIILTHTLSQVMRINQTVSTGKLSWLLSNSPN